MFVSGFYESSAQYFRNSLIIGVYKTSARKYLSLFIPICTHQAQHYDRHELKP